MTTPYILPAEQQMLDDYRARAIAGGNMTAAQIEAEVTKQHPPVP